MNKGPLHQYPSTVEAKTCKDRDDHVAEYPHGKTAASTTGQANDKEEDSDSADILNYCTDLIKKLTAKVNKQKNEIKSLKQELAQERRLRQEMQQHEL